MKRHFVGCIIWHSFREGGGVVEQSLMVVLAGLGHTGRLG